MNNENRFDATHISHAAEEKIATIFAENLAPFAEEFALERLQNAAPKLLVAAQTILAVIEEMQEEQGTISAFAVPAFLLREVIAEAKG